MDAEDAPTFLFGDSARAQYIPHDRLALFDPASVGGMGDEEKVLALDSSLQPSLDDLNAAID